MEHTHDIEKLKKELEAEKICLRFAIQKDVPFDEAKPIRQRISQLEKLIAAVPQQALTVNSDK